MKELEECKYFVYFYEGMPIDEDVINQVANQQKVSVTAKPYTMNGELHLGTKLQSGAKFQIEVEAYSDSKISVHERDVELLDRDIHNN